MDRVGGVRKRHETIKKGTFSSGEKSFLVTAVHNLVIQRSQPTPSVFVKRAEVIGYCPDALVPTFCNTVTKTVPSLDLVAGHEEGERGSGTALEQHLLARRTGSPEILSREATAETAREAIAISE